MKVAHLIKATRIAGAERHLMILLPGLRKRGIDARLMLMVEPDKPVDDFVDGLTDSGVPVERIIIGNHADMMVVNRIRQGLAADKPDILHTHLIHADLFGTIAGKIAGVPHLVISRHNDDAFRHRTPIKLLNRTLWSMASGGIAISEAIRQFCIDIEGASRGKVRTIHYGLPPQPPLGTKLRKELRRELYLSPDTRIAGMVCRLTEQKGVTYALQAFALLGEPFDDTHLVILGDGRLKDELIAEATALGIRHRAHFLGWKENAGAYMNVFDIFLMPSLWEGFGIVMLEAMAAAVPIIGSDVSAIPEVIEPYETGFLVPPRDPQAIAEALETLFADEPLRRHMGFLGQERLETVFSADRMIDETAAYYEKIGKG